MRFIGREEELAALAAEAHSAVAQRRLRVTLLLAPPGAGASGLLDEAARRTGLRVVRASAPRHPGGPALLTWRRLLGELGASSSAEDDLWSMEQALVSAFAATDGVLCLLDDLHRADEATLALLAELADRAPAVPVLMVAVVRPDADAVLPTGPAVHRLWLRGLAADDVRELLEDLTGRPVTAELAAQLWRRTDGAPAVLAAIAGQVREADDGRRRIVIRWPDPVRAEVSSRTAGLSEQAREVLTIASVVGREFDLSIVEAIAGDRALAAIDEALAAGVVSALPDQVFSFTSALTREISYDGLGIAGAAERHEQVADALIGLGARVGERAPTVGELAHHLIQATVLGGPERLDRAVAAAVAMAQAAAADADHGDAVAGYAVAADLAARAQWPPSALGRLYVALGVAHLAHAAHDPHTGSLAAGRAALDAAARLARHCADASLLAEAALGYGTRPGHGATAPPPDPDRRALLTEALASLNGRSEADVSTVSRLRARLALELSPSVAARQLAVDALAAARECADPRAMAEALLASEGIGVAELRQALREASALGDPALLARAHAAAAATLLGAGDVAGGDRQLAAVADVTGTRWAAAQAQSHRALLAGRAGEAMRHARDAGVLGRAFGEEAAALSLAAQVTAIALVTGEPGEVPAVLRAAGDAYRSGRGRQPAWLTAAAAWHAAVTGDLATAAALVDETLGLAPEPDPWTAALLADALPSAPDPGTVAALLDSLALASPWLVVGAATTSAGPRALVEARLLTLTGQLADATKALEAAGRLVGTTPWLPWLRVARARWLFARGATGDGELAAKELKAARAGAQDRGLSGLAARAETVGAPDGGGLTRRERDVLELAVAGASAKEIAEQLVIGERTVETHLANIYRKLGVRTRVELIAKISPPTGEN